MLRKIFLIVLLLGAGGFFVLVPSKVALSEDSPTQKAARIVKLLEQDKILSEDEQSELSNFVETLAPDQLGLAVFKQISDVITAKAVKDTQALQWVVSGVARLSQDSYASGVSHVSDIKLQALAADVQKLSQKVSELQNKVITYSQQGEASYYLKNIGAYVALLTGEGSFVSVPTVWETLKKDIVESYRAWSKESAHLSDVLQKNQQQYQSVSNYLTFEQQSFLDIFGSVQTNLRKISENDSTDF